MMLAKHLNLLSSLAEDANNELRWTFEQMKVCQHYRSFAGPLHQLKDPYGSFPKQQDPIIQYGAQNIIILIMGPAKKVPLTLGSPKP